MDYNIFYENADIDKKIKLEVKNKNKQAKIFSFIFLVVLLFLFKDSVLYCLRFWTAIPYRTETSVISTIQDPIQKNYTKDASIKKTFTYHSLINNKQVKIIPVAEYKISGLVVAYNKNFFRKNGFFDSVALYDLGLSWGKIGNKKTYNKYFKSFSSKNELDGSRVLWTKSKTSKSPISWAYASSHFSHSHIIPANRNIMAALLKIKKWNKVEIEGTLVDLEYIDNKGIKSNYKTSISRLDSNKNGDRGYGSCETIFVTQIKIGHKVYK